MSAIMEEAALLRLWREKRGEIDPEDLFGNLVQLGLVTEHLNRLSASWVWRPYCRGRLSRTCNIAVMRRRMDFGPRRQVRLSPAPFVQALQKFIGETHLKRSILNSSRRAPHKCIDLYNKCHYKFSGLNGWCNTRSALTKVKGTNYNFRLKIVISQIYPAAPY